MAHFKLETQSVPVAYDNESQLKRIIPYLIKHELLYAVYDCKGGGTGFVGVTDQRVIFYDQGTWFDQGMSAGVKKKRQMISIPFHQVIAVAMADEGIVFQTGELSLRTAAGTFSFEFRGSEKAHWAYRFILNQILNQANPQLRDKTQDAAAV